MIRRLAILGVGLIGGSLALALRRAGKVERIVGTGRGLANLTRALTTNVIDEIADTPAQAVAGADVVLLAVPVGSMARLMDEIAPHLSPNAALTDAGSTKRDVVAAARTALGARSARFVPGHPIAGAEKSGVAAARADLFDGKDVILTPLAENPPGLVERVTDMWLACGATVETMTDDEHDRIFAAVSHLPHLAAFALMEELAGRGNSELFFHHAGSGFRDFTRIAASHPEMWRDIALANREAICVEIDAYIAKLQAIRAMVGQGQGTQLMDVLERASHARNEWADRRGSPRN
jgi:prephenate dehydrogenase